MLRFRIKPVAGVLAAAAAVAASSVLVALPASASPCGPKDLCLTDTAGNQAGFQAGAPNLCTFLKCEKNDKGDGQVVRLGSAVNRTGKKVFLYEGLRGQGAEERIRSKNTNKVDYKGLKVQSVKVGASKLWTPAPDPAKPDPKKIENDPKKPDPKPEPTKTESTKKPSKVVPPAVNSHSWGCRQDFCVYFGVNGTGHRVSSNSGIENLRGHLDLYKHVYSIKNEDDDEWCLYDKPNNETFYYHKETAFKVIGPNAAYNLSEEEATKVVAFGDCSST